MKPTKPFWRNLRRIKFKILVTCILDPSTSSKKVRQVLKILVAKRTQTARHCLSLHEMFSELCLRRKNLEIVSQPCYQKDKACQLKVSRKRKKRMRKFNKRNETSDFERFMTAVVRASPKTQNHSRFLLPPQFRSKLAWRDRSLSYALAESENIPFEWLHSGGRRVSYWYFVHSGISWLLSINLIAFYNSHFAYSFSLAKIKLAQVCTTFRYIENVQPEMDGKRKGL